MKFMMKLLVYEKEPHFGKGIVQLLSRVEGGMSLNAAAAEMNMSYTKARRLLKSAEADMGVQLLEPHRGGAGREGSVLTDEGRALLQRYRGFEAEARRAVEQVFDRWFLQKG
ncbi:MAG: LysR family transcriptional regulator [Clostridia bacterium]|nr:LysR family transcriptional regulator [Clostridia bacterium]